MATNGKKGIVLHNTTAFISYFRKDRKFGAQAKGVLAEVGIDAFLAHDDLHVSDEWRERIVEELKRCDIFVPLLSANFSRNGRPRKSAASYRGLTSRLRRSLSMARRLSVSFLMCRAEPSQRTASPARC